MKNSRCSTRTGTVFLLRHGDSRQDKIKRYIGQADIPLNAEGRAQAFCWQQKLAHIPLERIFCSDLSRSIETARIIAEGRSESVQPLHKFREINLGAWDGLSFDDVQRLYPSEYERRGADMVTYRTPGGECFADLAARVIPLFVEIVRGSSGNLLIVGHSGVNMVIISHILGMPLENLFRIRQDYGCMNVIDFDSHGMRLRKMNLADPDDTPTPFYGAGPNVKNCRHFSDKADNSIQATRPANKL
jgi:probable phosphoglycerate mutase